MRWRLDLSVERETVRELRSHLEDEVEELELEGFSEEEATRTALQRFGPLRSVAGELSEVHNGVNWAETLVAAMPHIVFSMLFAFHQWSNVGWLLVTLVCTVGVTVYGWRHDKPTWFFTWLGYALIPLFVVGFLLLEYALSLETLGSSWWVWLLVVIYFPVILWLFVQIVIQVVKRDWLLGSLMALPVPPIIGWFMTARWREPFAVEGSNSVQALAPWIALSFLALAAIVVLFNRLKQRRLKVGALLLAGLAIVALVLVSSRGKFGLLNLAIMVAIVLFLLVGPALLEHRVVDRESESLGCLLERDLHRWAGGN